MSYCKSVNKQHWHQSPFNGQTVSILAHAGQMSTVWTLVSEQAEGRTLLLVYRRAHVHRELQFHLICSFQILHLSNILLYTVCRCLFKLYLVFGMTS